MFPEIHTERLTLRALDESDAERISAYRSDPKVSRFQSWGSESAESVRCDIRRFVAIDPGKATSWYQVGIVLRSGGELIGDCGFRTSEGEPQQAEIGVALAPEFQGRGYAGEALAALLDYLFLELRRHRVFGSVDPRNFRSVKLLERAGMRKEAHFVKSLWFRGEWVDDVIFAVLAGDWKSGKIR